MLRLEFFTPADFDRLIAWAHNEEILIQFAGQIFNFPLTQSQLQMYLDDPDRICYKVLVDDEVIGHAEIYVANAEVAVLCRLLIGEERYRNRGLGAVLIRQLLNTCFAIMKMDSTELNVFDWNAPAIRCYKKAGFKVNPERTRVRKVGELTWVALNMSMSKEDWLIKQYLQS